MPTTKASRSGAMFLLALLLSFYVLVSISVAVATAGDCDGRLNSQKTWQPFPPHWECPVR